MLRRFSRVGEFVIQMDHDNGRPFAVAPVLNDYGQTLCTIVIDNPTATTQELENLAKQIARRLNDNDANPR